MISNVVPAIPLHYLQRQHQATIVPPPTSHVAVQKHSVPTKVSDELSNGSKPVPTASHATGSNNHNGNNILAHSGLVMPTSFVPGDHVDNAVAQMGPLNDFGATGSYSGYNSSSQKQGMAATPAHHSASGTFPHPTVEGSQAAIPFHNGPSSGSPPVPIPPSFPNNFPLPPSDTFAYPPNPVSGAPPPGLPQPPRFPYHGLHQAHPSNGTVNFGALESNSTSPTPNSAGIFPPPGLPYMGIPRLNEWDRPYGPFPGAVNGFPPMTPGFGTSSPHSFHGSQSSLPNEENGFPRNPALNGQSPYGVTPALDARRMGPPSFLSIDPRQAQGVFGQVELSFGDAEFADCEIKIQLDAPPTQSRADGAKRGDEQNAFSFLGHRLVLGQSPQLQKLFRQSSPAWTGRVPQYQLSLTDPYFTSGSVHVAFGAMYGLRLQDIPLGTNDAAGRGRALDEAIALVAIGNFLDLTYVSIHGVSQSVRLVDWANIDKALTFCLGGAANLHIASPNDPPVILPCVEAIFKYGKGFGEHIREFLIGLMEFVVQNFPANFVLDTTVPDASYGRIRLTPLPTTPARLHSGSVDGAVEINGETKAASPEGRPPSQRGAVHRLAHIQFGDLSPAAANGDEQQPRDENTTREHGPSEVSRPAAPLPGDSVSAVLSQILLSLPLDYLRYVMEHPHLRSPSGWMMPEVRLRVLRDVVGERERRRLRAVGEVQTEQVQDYDATLARLQAERPPTPSHGADADVMGWKEKVAPGPRTIHEWQPLSAAGGGHN